VLSHQLLTQRLADALVGWNTKKEAVQNLRRIIILMIETAYLQ
jgi:hypothetical protein